MTASNDMDFNLQNYPVRDRLGRVRHLGIIPDGGRRWAEANGRSLLETYSISVEKLEEIAHAFYERGGMTLSVYLSSRFNHERPWSELQPICELLSPAFYGPVLSIANRWGVAVKVVGGLEIVPDEYLVAAREIMKATEENTREMFLCLAYDPAEDLNRACQRAAAEGDCAQLLQHLSVPRPLDLVVRTGGARSLSNFLPLQAAYARLIFLDPLFNDTVLSDYLSVMKEHEQIDLRYGQ